MTISPLLGQAQPERETKIMKDIEVAENILASLLKEEASSDGQYFLFSSGASNNVQGTYIKDFGALFTIGGRNGSFPLIIGQGNGNYSYSYNLKGLAKLKSELPYAVNIYSEKDRDRKRDNADQKETDEVDVMAYFKSVAEEFIVNYGYVIRGIQPQEKILIRYGTNRDNGIAIWHMDDEKELTNGVLYTAMVLKSDIDALQKGNLTEEQLAGKIIYTEGEAEKEEGNKDLKLMNSIFSRLYREDLSGTTCIRGSGTPKSEYIPDLGMVVQMDMNVRCRGDINTRFNRLDFFRDGEVRGVAPLAEADDKETKEGEIKENPDEEYPQFLQDLKQNIIEYGSIAKSLAKDEILVFKVAFSGCRDCKVIPENLSITAKESTLTAYRQGSLSLEKAINQLSIN